MAEHTAESYERDSAEMKTNEEKWKDFELLYE